MTETQIYQVYIKATPQAIWDAITDPEWSVRYGYRGRSEFDLRPGGSYRAVASAEMQAMGVPEVVVDGEVVEVDPPRRLAHSWRALGSDEIKAEGPTHVTYEIEEGDGGVCRLTVTHELVNAPETSAMVAGKVEGAGGGWPYLLSDLKTLLETGQPLEV